jgi:magnesium-transporting ATPase (P-type)
MEDQYIEPEEQPEEESKEEAVDIYSRQAILGFSIFFSTIFGGVLLFWNLRNVGYKKAANGALLFSICYSLFCMLLVSSVKTFAFAPLFFNVAGGVILSSYFFPKYFPDNDYYPKPIWKPLIISLLICAVLMTIVYYGGGMPELKALKAK